MTADSINNESHLKFFFSQPPLSGSRAGILLDRDGVINERIMGGFVTSWSQFRFRDGVIPALAAFTRLDLPIVVVSNQSGIGRNLFSPEALKSITEQFVSGLKAQHARIDAVYYCPHTSDNDCDCRKPRPGLLLAAARDWHLDLERSVLVGDTESDLQAARAVNCRAVFFPSHHSASAAAKKHLDANLSIVTDASELFAAVHRLLPKSSEP
jgi:D-glycero-D-manno-heptose 1,7-bisphosphate phosphatase